MRHVEPHSIFEGLTQLSSRAIFVKNEMRPITPEILVYAYGGLFFSHLRTIGVLNLYKTSGNHIKQYNIIHR